MNLNFKLSELIHSDTANIYKINNMPDINSLDNLQELIYFCLQPIRDKIKKPMIITSGYRNSQVNKLVGGSETSEHKRGMAADFIIHGMTNTDIVKFIKNSGIKYTQLIEEHSKSASWVHISYDKKNLKCETLLYKNGKYVKI